MDAQGSQKAIQRGSQKCVEILIDFGSHFDPKWSPKWSQKSPKGAQVASKRGPNWTLKAKLAPRASQRPPEGHFWSVFGAILDDFGIQCNIFWCDFR